MSTKSQESAVRSMKYENNPKLIFVTGGARSGKSAFALEMANSLTPPQSSPWQGGDEKGGRKCYLATAQALDSEMEDRIAKHKAERGGDWDCIEEPLLVAEKIKEVKGKYSVILFDCLTLWVSNLMLREQESEVGCRGVVTPPLPKSEVEDLIAVCKTSGSTVIVVSNEVGFGIVPDNALARKFRDLAGTANQLFAKAADEVYFVVSGIPMKLK